MKTTIDIETSLGVRHLLQSFANLDKDFKGRPLTDAVALCVAKIGNESSGSPESEMHKAMLHALLTAAIVDRLQAPQR